VGDFLDFHERKDVFFSFPPRNGVFDFLWHMAELGAKKIYALLPEGKFEKLTDFPGSPRFNATCLLLQFYYKINKIKEFDPHVTYPLYFSNLVFVEMIRKKEQDPGFDSFVRQLYRYRGKKIWKALSFMGYEIEREGDIVDFYDGDELFEIYGEIKR
jgi:16S rRNA A1518/A1519 N6-dimethyltransferase RsmA/KsgA/DIM1 with predicted DNA glycosylase/AP lyase activity